MLPTGDEAPQDCGDRTPHPPIRITEDVGSEGFILGRDAATGQPIHRPGSGVIAGNGTRADPYVIAGWCVAPTDTSDPLDFPAAVRLQETDAHVVLRDNVVNGTPTGDPFFRLLHDGIRLDGTANVTLTDNLLVGNEKGVLLNRSAGTTLTGNRITRNDCCGVHMHHTAETTLANNTILNNTGTTGTGIVVSRSEQVAVRNNTLVGNDWDAVYMSRTSETVLANNTIVNNTLTGIGAYRSEQVAVRNNTLTGNSDGVSLRWTRGAAVVDNVIAGSSHEAIQLSLRGPYVVQGNNIQDNGAEGLVAHFGWFGNQTVNATGNWWGSPSGPSGGDRDACTGTVADGDGELIKTGDDAGVCFDPWLEARNPDAGASS